MVTVRVINRNGDGVSGADVHISWSGSWTHSSGRTNSRGEVSFDVSSGSGEILVDGQSKHNGRIDDLVTVPV